MGVDSLRFCWASLTGLGSAASATVMMCIVGCVQSPNGPSNDNVETTPHELQLPAGFPMPVIPEDNPLTDEKIALGRFLFYDTRLSGNGTQSCSSCHVQEHGFADPRAKSLGSTGEMTTRNAPGLANSIYYSSLTWSSRLLLTFEQQMILPMFGEDPIEMGITGHEEEVLQRLRDDVQYQQMFAAAFPNDEDPVAIGNIVGSIASFLRTMIAGDSPWHRAIYQGDDSAIDDSVRRGADLFFSERLECHHCHGGFNFSQATRHDGTVFEEFAFHNTGLYNLDGEGAYPPSDQGLIRFTGNPTDMGKFRAPSLMNIALTAPYFHDGSVPTLREVIAVYEAGGRLVESGPNAGDGRTNPFRSGFIKGFTLTEDERNDLIAFLEALTDETFINNPQFSNPFENEP